MVEALETEADHMKAEVELVVMEDEEVEIMDVAEIEEE